MTPKATFDDVWDRCEQLSSFHTFLNAHLSSVVRPDEILRAEWVARVSALDLFVHELVSQQMREIFEGVRPTADGYLKFQVSNDTVNRIRAATTTSDASAAFDLEVRQQLSGKTFQSPENIAAAIRCVTDVELWNQVALKLGATEATKVAKAKSIRKQLSLIVERRNKIAHEGDLQPSSPRTPWPITKADLQTVSAFILEIVGAITALLP